MRIRGFLFDLDGTLADTAPDLVAVLNSLLTESGRAPMPFAIARNEVSNGAVGLLRLGYGLAPDADVDPALRQRFLDRYSRNICVATRLFLSVVALQELAASGDVRWGIVTNKPVALTNALLAALGIADLAGCIVGGDTIAQKKPHPAPLLHAAALLSLPPAHCVYIGDSRRDIQAGKAAGMCTIAATYGYIRPFERVGSWGADSMAGHPQRLLGILAPMARTSFVR